MRRLGARIAVNVAAVVLTGLLLVDTAFLFWSARRHARERYTELMLAASAAALDVYELRIGRPSPLPASMSDRSSGTRPVEDSTRALLEARLGAVAAQHDASITLLRDRVVLLTTARPPLDLSQLGREAHAVTGGLEHVAVDLAVPAVGEPAAAPADGSSAAGAALVPGLRVVASRRVGSVADLAVADQRAALLLLATVGTLMLLTALVLLRRAVVVPLRRITTLVGAADNAGLSRFGEADGDLGELSRAIIAMAQRIEEDRRRIAAQLAELRAAHGELTRTQQQLVRAERLSVVGKLAAGLAHEIGNPLAVLSGYAEVLKDPELPQPTREDSVERMARELDRIHHTVRALLDFSRAPASATGQGEVGEALEHVRGLLAPQDDMRNIELQVIPPASPVEVPVDGGGLTQVLLNLALNAVHAVGGAGRIRIAVEPPEGGHVRILVEDSGPGIPEEIAARVFEPFFTTKPAGRGSGLGLAVCESIVSTAGGEITAGSSPSLGGARFCVSLPVAGIRRGLPAQPT